MGNAEKVEVYTLVLMAAAIIAGIASLHSKGDLEAARERAKQLVEGAK